MVDLESISAVYRGRYVPVIGVLILHLLTAGLICVAAARAYGQSTADSVQRGVQAFEAGDFEQAQSYFSIAVKQAPSATSLDYLALAEARLGQLDQAINHFRQSIRLGNNSAKVHYDLGLAYTQQGRGPAAIQEFQQAIAIDPNQTRARYDLALALLNTGRSREAITHLIQLQLQNPREPQFWATLVRAQFEAGNASDAMRTIDTAVEAIPTDLHLITTLAGLCSAHQQRQRARLLLEDANELMPEDPELKLALASASLRAGEPIEALAALEGISSNQGKAGEISTMRGMALAYTGKFEAAAAELYSALTADPQNPKYLVASAWIRQLEGQHEEALSVLDKARKLDPNAPVIPYRIAVSYFFLFRYSLSTQKCQESINLDTRFDPSYFLLGVTKLKQRDYLAAQHELMRAVALEPRNALYHRELARALFESGEFEQSQKELDRALLLKREDPESYFLKALLIEHRGDPQEAIRALETAVALKTDYHQAYTELARLLAAEGRVREAAQIESKVAANNPDGRDDLDNHILFQLKNSSNEPDDSDEDVRKTKQ